MPEQQARAELARMLQAIRHEAFYVCGAWADPEMGVYVAWAARQGSFSEPMPIFNERRDVTLVFSGEDYPEPQLTARLKQRGHVLLLDGPSYLIHLYEDEPTFPACLDGIFHGLVVDRNRGSATLFNDRYGMQRLYFHDSGEAFYFAAEAKAILAARPQAGGLDPRGLGEFISLGCVLENRSLFEKINVLPPAAAWVFRNGSLERAGAYFQPREWEQQERLSPESYYRELRDVISRTVPRCFRGRDRVAIALTGGLDTRVIMAWAKASPGSLPCYTFGGLLRESQDVRIGRKVAMLCGQRHEVLTIGQEFLSRFPHYAERTAFLGEGCVSIANSPDLYVSELARQIAPIKIVGTWGSELLRAAATFKPRRAYAGLYQPELLGYAEQAEAVYARIRKQHPVTFAAFRQTPWAQYGIEALEQTQLGIRPPFLANDFVRAVYCAPDHDSADVRGRLVAEANPALASIPSDRGVAAASTAFTRLPARFWQEFTFKGEYAFDAGMPQWFARAFRPFLPLRLDRLFLGRHKFLHFRTWYQNGLSDYVRQILLDPVTLSRPFLRRHKVEEMVRSHTQGLENHTLDIHNLLTLELVCRHFGGL
jgi:asparagine synthase (glutamine-hydrolysing)